jgi:predicted DNA-binding transcriptional regulator YafY
MRTSLGRILMSVNDPKRTYAGRCTWGDEVEVVKPKRLVSMLRREVAKQAAGRKNR